MAFNFMERLGSMLGQKVVERMRRTPQAAPPSEAEAAAPEAEAVPTETYAEAAPAEAPAEPAPAEQVAYTEPVAAQPVEAAPEVVSYAPEPAPAVSAAEPVVAADATLTTPTVDTVAAPDAAVAPPAEEVSFAPPAEAVAEAPAAPEKSAEEIEEERLWGEVEAAWGASDFQKVTEALDRLRELQPEDSALIDEKIAAAQYNQASSFEQAGDLERALYLYQEAQRRNPALGEAGFAIERVQAALQPPAPAPEAAPEPAPEQTYTVADGDTLSAIAAHYYGSADEWPRIFEANRDQLDNPDLIYPGQVLRIPS